MRLPKGEEIPTGITTKSINGDLMMGIILRGLIPIGIIGISGGGVTFAAVAAAASPWLLMSVSSVPHKPRPSNCIVYCYEMAADKGTTQEYRL